MKSSDVSIKPGVTSETRKVEGTLEREKEQQKERRQIISDFVEEMGKTGKGGFNYGAAGGGG